MRNKLRALKKSDKKGFTLVELIVVPSGGHGRPDAV